MKVHPTPNHRNLTVHYTTTTTTAGVNRRQKKLRRLPHIFAKVLELPFYSDADVSVHETSESLRFVIGTDDDVIRIIGTDISAHTIEIYPGVTKIVVGGTNGTVNGYVSSVNGSVSSVNGSVSSVNGTVSSVNGRVSAVNGFVSSVNGYVSLVDELEVDVWRFRLPACTVPELATASFRDGELVVVVPKDINNLDGNEGNGTGTGTGTGRGQFVIVQ